MKTDGGRSYDSPLRTEQAAGTRQRILQALADLLVEEQPADVSITEVAARAGVAERTVYRHFPTRQDLFSSLFGWLIHVDPAELEQREVHDLGGITDIVRRLWRRYGEHPELYRALNGLAMSGEMRQTRTPNRKAQIESASAEVTEGLTPADRRRFHAVTHLLTSGAAFMFLNEFWAMDGEEAADAVTWAIAHLAKAAQQEQ